MPRRWPRILANDPATLTLPDRQRRPVILKQLSAGGARVQSPIALSAHAIVMLRLDLGPGRRLNLEAVVVYCQHERQGLHYMSGLRFTHIDHNGVAEIVTYIEEENLRRKGSGQTWRG